MLRQTETLTENWASSSHIQHSLWKPFKSAQKHIKLSCKVYKCALSEREALQQCQAAASSNHNRTQSYKWTTSTRLYDITLRTMSSDWLHLNNWSIKYQVEQRETAALQLFSCSLMAQMREEPPADWWICTYFMSMDCNYPSQFTGQLLLQLWPSVLTVVTVFSLADISGVTPPEKVVYIDCWFLFKLIHSPGA